jgi:hypothetical protein
MRRTIISLLMPLVWGIPAAAQDLPPERGAQQTPASQAPSGQSTSGQSASEQSIGQNFRSNLARADCTEIRMVPVSFVVRAKDPNGVSVMIVLSPDSITVLTEAAPGDASGLPSDQAPDAGTPAPDRCVPPNADEGRLGVAPPIELAFDIPVTGSNGTSATVGRP